MTTIETAADLSALLGAIRMQTAALLGAGIDLEDRAAVLNAAQQLDRLAAMAADRVATLDAGE